MTELTYTNHRTSRGQNTWSANDGSGRRILQFKGRDGKFYYDTFIYSEVKGFQCFGEHSTFAKARAALEKAGA